MKKTIFFIATALCLSQSMMAIKPLLTEGYDKFNNSFKIDLVSVGYMSPQIVWEHYTNTRFSFGVSAQTHFVNRSTAPRAFEQGEVKPTQVQLDGINYNLNWEGHPAGWYADANKVGEDPTDKKTYEVKWNRKYVGVMVCPEGRFYFGRKPNRGFYAGLRMDMGLFQEQFDVERTTLDKEYINSIPTEQRETDSRYLKYQKNQWDVEKVEKGETFLAAGVGGCLGFQGWFKKNAHWGFDLNCWIKSDWKFSEDDNTWEWFWDVELPADLNASIIYRF